MGVDRGSADELGGIDHRATADGEEEDVLWSDLLHNLNGLHAGIEIGVGLDSTKLVDFIAFKSLHDLVVDSILHDGAASVDDKDLLILGNVLGELRNLIFTKNDAGRIGKVKVLHGHL